MVSWPREFSKVHKNVIKGSTDLSTLSTTTRVAKVVEFSEPVVSVFDYSPYLYEIATIFNNDFEFYTFQIICFKHIRI